MRTYTVTPELHTSLWMKILRFFLLKKKREEFFLTLSEEIGIRKGDILDCNELDGTEYKYKIIE